MKEAPMTIKPETLREELQALLGVQDIALPDYAADPIVQRRVGRMLGDYSTYLKNHYIGAMRGLPSGGLLISGGLPTLPRM